MKELKLSPDDNFEDVLESVIDYLSKNMEDIPEEFQKIVNDIWWELLD